MRHGQELFKVERFIKNWHSNWTSAFTRQNTVYELCFGEFLCLYQRVEKERRSLIGPPKQRISSSVESIEAIQTDVCVCVCELPSILNGLLRRTDSRSRQNRNFKTAR